MKKDNHCYSNIDKIYKRDLYKLVVYMDKDYIVYLLEMRLEIRWMNNREMRKRSWKKNHLGYINKM